MGNFQALILPILSLLQLHTLENTSVPRIVFSRHNFPRTSWVLDTLISSHLDSLLGCKANLSLSTEQKSSGTEGLFLDPDIFSRA
ncbi:hypothetical protein GcM1_05870 [Golovinomyces cichoracearum]|uniref:Uncharacterized protein n=1 Tax=Golovinomyces cichoracearum TaxID=62708 RepID=A0A420J4Z9_9PEZI|nr:hypothetical protein GcM1_05870 [Golovinomyces cichoracearum]